MATERYFVEVVDYETEEVVDRIKVDGTKRKAERVERGVNINMNHDRYFTRVVLAEKKG